jgi:hypothetical protein
LGLKDVADILGPEWQTFIKVVLGGVLWHLITKCYKKGIKDIVRAELAPISGLEKRLSKGVVRMEAFLSEWETYKRRIDDLEMRVPPRKVNGVHKERG